MFVAAPRHCSGLGQRTQSRALVTLAAGGRDRRGHYRQTRGSVAASAGQEPSSTPSGVAFFEVDGGLLDLHMDGHRVAFNKSLIDLGYEVSRQSDRDTCRPMLTHHTCRLDHHARKAPPRAPLSAHFMCAVDACSAPSSPRPSTTTCCREGMAQPSE